MAAVPCHVVRVGVFPIDGLGNKIDKNALTTTVGTMMQANTEHLVIPDATVPNSANWPTIPVYLKKEANDGYTLRHIDQTMIVTYSP